MDFLAFIPARGGSKGIPRKNIQLLAGKPLLQYTIEAALESKKLDYIFLSSDNEEIIEFGRRFKIDADYKRPTAVAQDSTSTADTVLDGLEWLKTTKNIEPPLYCAFATDITVAHFRRY